MTLHQRILPFVPTDSLLFWQFLHKNPTHGFFFGSGVGTEDDHLLYMSAANPVRLMQTLPPLKKPSNKSALPRYVGMVDFEGSRLCDPALERLSIKKNPLGRSFTVFGDYRSVVQVDLLKKETTLVAENVKELKRIEGVLRKTRFLRESRSSVHGTHFKRMANRKHFFQMVIRAKEFIRRGDIYQANLSVRFQDRYNGDPVALYRRLNEKNPSPYACLIKQFGAWIVSCSPELLLRVKGRLLVTRPIAGTRPRGKTVYEDRLKRGQLLLSPKERAEHIMLVDLERNDLGRVADPGSVRVKERFTVERYSHVMHIVSQVEGRLMRNKNSIDAFKAVFPGGTITGCPKIKAVEVIQFLENQARGPFYGSAGFFAWNNDAVFNILIRTALIHKNKIHVQAGAGIVADSDPEREYNEVLAKAHVWREAI